MSNSRRDIKKFLLKLFVFSIPLILLFGFPALTLLFSGELLSLRAVIWKQTHGSPTVLGLAYSNPDKHYKLQMTLARNPEVLALGSSRIMQIRDFEFLQPGDFYNAGGAVARIDHFRKFLKLLPPEQTPRLLLICLDQYYFNPNWENLKPDGVELAYAAETDGLELFWSNWRKVYSDYGLGKYTLAQAFLPSSLEIGLAARSRHGTGFRNDGSYRYGNRLTDPTDPNDPDYQFRDTLKRIEERGRRFERGEQLSPAALSEMQALLDECQARKIAVVAFLPPYAPSIYKKMVSTGDYTYLGKLPTALEPLMLASGTRLFDFTDPASISAGDDEFIDGFHPGDRAVLKMLILMSAADERLKPFMERARLESLLKHSPDSLQVELDPDWQANRPGRPKLIEP